MYTLHPIISLSLACFSLEPRLHLLLSINCHLWKQRKKSYTFQRSSLILQRVTSITCEFTTKHSETKLTKTHRFSVSRTNSTDTSFKFPRNCSTNRIEFKIQLKITLTY
ncbi:hypothetical protein EUGRSUZ_E02924 [Eucalyptus grandis]|uniref:Uncharacterized protein n=2 Tax=Eucalyptus grandis TaxID=71139 RepID=A0ACC3KXR9_EUCGR|nr:hypothetical protein EUGRSUZ_E02924 [Eucalyptus grandis]